MCTCIFQPRWIFHWRGYRGGITHLLTFKEISSQEGHLDFQNEKRVVSYVLSGPGLSISFLLLWNFSSQGTNSTHSPWGPPLSCLRPRPASSFCHTFYTESQRCGWHDPRSCHLQIGIAIGTCPLSLQGSNYELLRLLTFHTPWKELTVESRKQVALSSGKTARTGLQIWSDIQEKILWAWFFYLLQSRKTLKPFMVMMATHD